MKENIYKYFSEIVIIVIGVLIAFYVSNWGQEVAERRSEKEVIAQIYFELSDNLIDLQNDLVVHQTALNSHLKIQQFLDDPLASNDSLMMDYYWVTKDEYIFPNTSAFEKMKNAGLSIIENDALRDLIILVYNNNFPRITKGNNLHPDINEYLRPYFQKNFKVNRDPNIMYTIEFNDSLKINYPRDFGNGIKQIIGYIPLNVEKLKQDEEFKFLISESLWFRLYKLRYYESSIKMVEQILNLIKSKYPNTIGSKR